MAEERSLKDILDSINKKYGKETILVGTKRAEKMPKIPTGSFTADLAMHGGVPVGRVTIFWGSESSGKSTIAQKVVASAQKMCANCYAFLEECKCKEKRVFVTNYQDVEGTWDNDWAKILGVDTSTIIYSNPEFSEEAIDVIDALLRSGKVDLIVVDSLAMMVPSQIIERSSEEPTMGAAARLNNTAFAKWRSAMDEARKSTGRRPTLLVVNQVRQKIGIVYGSPDTLPGGVGQLFSASMIVKMRRGKYELTDGESKIPLSVELHGLIEKSKVSPPRHEYSFRLALNDHIDKDIQIKKGEIKEFEEVRKIAEANGLFTKRDGKYYYGKHEYTRLHELWADWVYNREGLEKVKKDLLSILV